MLQSKRRFSVPVSGTHRLRLDRDTSDTPELSSSDADSKTKEDQPADSSLSCSRSQQPSRTSKKNIEDKLMSATSGRPNAQSNISNVIYTGSISVNPSCLVPADSLENAFQFTSGSLTPNSGRLDTITTRASVDSTGSTVSTSTSSSSKRRHSSQPPKSSRPHSKKQSTSGKKSNGVSHSPNKATVQVLETKPHQIGPSRPGRWTQPASLQSKIMNEAIQPTKLISRERSNVGENGAPESGRKSVTIMLKTSPTHEFHSTKALQTQHIGINLTPHVRPQCAKKVAEIVAVPEKPEQPIVKSSPISPSKQNTPVAAPLESAVTKVLEIVNGLKNKRRRPVQSVIIELARDFHDLTETEVLSALNCLVSESRLQQVSFPDGISYRFFPSFRSHGDAHRPTTLSAKIKAKYASKVNRKRPRTTSHLPGAAPGSKRSSSTELHNTASKKPRQSTAMANSSPGFCVHNSWPNPANQSWPAYQSTFGRILKPTAVRAVAFQQISRDGVLSNQPVEVLGSDSGNNSSASISKSLNATDDNAIGAHEASGITPQALGSRIFVVPPASPVRDANVENRFNSLPHRCLGQSPPSTEAITTARSGDRTESVNRNGDRSASNPVLTTQQQSEPHGSTVHLGSGSGGQNSASRRTSTRHTDAVYKFKSIFVKKNAIGGFTEFWLQSPGSPLKNAFTVQVLEELTVALNQAVFDSSRLVMICGMGTVFSAGIDLTQLIGPLPSRSSFLSGKHPHFTTTTPPDWDRPSTSTGHSSNHCCCGSQCVTSANNCNKFPQSNSSSGCPNHNYPVDPSICQRLGSVLRAFLLALVAFPKPVVVGVNGPAMGLAVAILPLCDLANELLLTGRKLSAREALQRGLVSDLLYPKCFKDELVMRCRKLSCSSSMALEMTKCIVRMQHRERIEFVINTECRKLIELWQTAEFRNSAVNFLFQDMDDFL
ncbi:Chromodomain Y protein [Fasciolopsis buskii]|uniref:Chromodomain Y protein n=1 Tax=Fasciolopsis buskii TaxID=27845 RepID=A0A8E0VJ49_9TREM|nr:Chromodomain Y protein [Fasciolopsis buski]